MRGSVAQPGTASAHGSTVVRLADAAETARVGAAIAAVLEGGMIVTLSGDLGAGKTTLVRGVLRARGIEGAIKSPTYALVEHYRVSSLYFYHVDFYRFADPDEWETAGLTECFRDDAVCLIEWPERVANLLPPADIALSLALEGHRDGRTLAARAFTAHGKRCVDAIVRAFSGATASS
ncbi:MAG TPA: tRNA (adenosine(37)-N6)-threonylcarbamoyltransferase complex ATPase subunit type 1 TsaE [Casimicrobiaceae bacterium]|nr:tRNA (adenosine(37)-N6)-threonylcarbamoyltransferase complex ATPase subunit type 1 TsaE [Casimicrobiaceae bacterium]